ncbi:MAG TPA: hypothetical protein VF588_23305 [Pyrinomonadaceae bacterium]|jgi:hypothetical protein
MQNYNNPGQPPPPQGGYGAPPPTKKGMSTGVKILIGVLFLVVGGGGLLLALGIGGAYYLTRRVQENAGASRPGLSGLTGTSGAGAEAEPPAPTADQRAAIAGGQTAAWEQQEISWTLPQKWKKHSADSQSLLWRSPGSWDAASLIVNISPLAADFPSDISLKTNYDSFSKDKQKYAEVRWLKLGGVKGVMFRETAPESADTAQRLQWIGFRDYKGQKQMVNIMLASRGKDFARHEDALYGILYSTDLGQ